MNFELALDAKCLLAETPIWDPRIKKLYWTALFTGDVHRYDPATGKDEVAHTGMKTIGAAIPCDTVGKLMVAVDEGMMLFDFETGALELIAAPIPNTGEYRYNDSRCDKAGRIFTSTVSMAYTEPNFDIDTMSGKFYMIDTDGTVVTLVDKLVQFNTIFFNNANTALYAVDTYYKKLYRFNYSIEKGAWGEPEVVIEFADMPDGVSVDSEDNIYVCHWSAEKYISVYSLNDYKLKDKISFPVSNICCGGFAGEDMKDFYVATSFFGQKETDSDVIMGAGGLFKARNPIAGVQEIFYKDKK